MVWKQIFKTVSFYLYVLSGILCLPLAISAYYQFIAQPSAHLAPYETLAFFNTILVTLCAASLLHVISRKCSKTLFRREGICAVVLIWVITPAFSALPFMFNGTLEHFEDAYFEMTSGFTTTGTSILYPKKYDANHKEIPYHSDVNNALYAFYGTVKPVLDPITHEPILTGIEAVGKGLLFWRSLTQWLGGIGIVLFFIAILPSLEGGAKILFQSETAGPIKEALTPRIRDAAFLLFKIYIGLTIVQIILLMFHIPFFDALTLSFSTISSGGFSVLNNSLAGYNNAATDWIVVIFMILGTINFALFYYLIRGKFYRLRDPELMSYLIIVCVFSLIVIWNLSPYMKIDDAIRYGTFQIVSAITTTGFATANYDYWPAPTQSLMLIAMFIGGMSGSTAGGIKVIRHYILTKLAIHKTESIFHPESVRVLHYGNAKVSQSMGGTILCFFFIYIAVGVLATLVYIFSGIDPETALGLSSSNLNNVGFAFRMAGPAESCAFLSPLNKYFSCFLMFLGRLELFVPLLLFIPAFWRKN